MSKNKHTGDTGESLAAEYLQQSGFNILERNWRCKHWEVDIIASKADRLHFIEVKTRRNEKFGKPEARFTAKKMSALKNAAEAYLLLHPEWTRIRFDIVSIMLKGEEVEELLVIEDVYF